MGRGGSRSMRHWAVLLEEGLRERLDSFRQQLLEKLPKVQHPHCSAGGPCGYIALLPHPTSDSNYAVWRPHLQELSNEEIYWTGCNETSIEISLKAASQYLHMATV